MSDPKYPKRPGQTPSAMATPRPDWEGMASSPAFQDLLRSKIRFIGVATVFFLTYYFALPILSGYWPDLMGRKVLGEFSLAYVFAFSQFPMAWIVAAIYLRVAAKFDRQAAAVVREYGPDSVVRGGTAAHADDLLTGESSQ